MSISIVKSLSSSGYDIWGWGTDRPRGTKDGVTYVSGKFFDGKAMRIDIFWSYIDKEMRLKNDSRKGLYHKSNLPVDIVLLLPQFLLLRIPDSLV